MSVANSTMLPDTGRSSTRRAAPPGGRTTIQLGTDEPEAKRAAAVATPPRPSAEEKEIAAGEEVTASTLKVGLVISTGPAADTLKDETVKELRARGITNVVGYTVADIVQLPFAASFIIKNERVDAVVALGALTESTWSAPANLQAALSGLIQAGLQSSIAIVPAIVAADSVRDAKQTIKQSAGRWAASVLALTEIQSGNAPAFDVAAAEVSLSTPVKKAPGASAGAAAAPASVSILLTRLRESLKQHGARGIHGLARKFRIMDDDNSGDLDISEFKKAIAEHAFDWTEPQIREVFNYFDNDGGGTINYDEFLVGVRGELNPRRAQLVLLAFDRMDADKNGFIEVDDIMQLYDASQHPDVISGKKTHRDVFKEFLDTFDVGEKDGKVTPAEFMRYYGNVSASIDEDDYFELMIRNAWHISGGEGQAANSTCRRVLVTHPDGRQTVEELKDDLGLRGDDKEGIMKKLRDQGVDASGVDLFGALDTTTPAATSRPAAASSAAAAPRTRQAPGGRTTIVLG